MVHFSAHSCAAAFLNAAYQRLQPYPLLQLLGATTVLTVAYGVWTGLALLPPSLLLSELIGRKKGRFLLPQET